MKKIFLFLIFLLVQINCFALWGWGSGDAYNEYPSAAAISNAITKKANCKIVYPGDNLQTAYDSIKGDASSSSVQMLLLADGVYTGQALTLDTSYTGLSSLSGNPDACKVTNSTGDTVTQTAAIVYVRGIYFETTGNTAGDTPFTINVSGGAANTDSIYRTCKFYNTNATAGKNSVFFETTADGEWWFCDAGNYSWRCATGIDFKPKMYYCYALLASFAGDNEGDGPSGGGSIIDGCEMYYCYGLAYSFAGCLIQGTNIESGAVFYGCRSGLRSFGVGAANAGTFYDCHSSDHSFGGTPEALYGGSFSGYAENCSATGNSFGISNDVAITDGSLSGTLVNCNITGAGTRGTTLTSGATIDRCTITFTEGTNIDAITLKDSNTKIYNSRIFVDSSETGVPISDDGSSRDVIVVNTVMNNSDNDADGLDLGGGGSNNGGNNYVLGNVD